MTHVATPLDLSRDFMQFVCDYLGVPLEGLIALRVTLRVTEKILIETEHVALRADGKPDIDSTTGTFKRELSSFRLLKVD